MLPLGTHKAVTIVPTFCIYPFTSELPCCVVNSSNPEITVVHLHLLHRIQGKYLIFSVTHFDSFGS